MPLSLALSISEYIAAARRPPASEPANSQFLRPIATTREGALAQLRFLAGFIEEGFDYDEDCDRLVANVIAGIERLPTGGAA